MSTAMEMQSEGFILIDTFQTEKKYLLYGNFYPSKSFNLHYIIFGMFMFIYSWIEFGSMVAVLFVEKDNLTKLSETLLFCMTQAAFLCKLTNFLIQKNKMFEIEHLLKHPVLNDLDKTEKSILNGYMVQFKYLSRVYRTLCILCVTFYGLFPFIDDDPEHMLPLPGWFPFDIKKYQYEILLGQTMGIGIGAFNNSTLDLLATILITVGSAQFDILKLKLQSIIKVTSNNKKVGLVKIALNNCIRYHSILLEYISTVEELFSTGIFVQFFASVVVMCLTGFQMIVISVKSIQFISLMIYFSTMTCQIALYCWYGNGLMLRSMELPESCYMSNWNDYYDPDIYKSLFIIMERGKRPIVIRAGKLFSLSLTTLMTILKSSYSYFAVLRRLYSKD